MHEENSGEHRGDVEGDRGEDTAAGADQDMEEDNFAKRKVKILPDISPPTKAEYDEHQILHGEYRDWCEACVAGRAQGRTHREQLDREGQVPTVSMDFASMAAAGYVHRRRPGQEDSSSEKDSEDEGGAGGDRGDREEDDIYGGTSIYKRLKMLVIKDRRSKCLSVRCIPTKSPQNEYATKGVVQDLDYWGHTKVILRSDGEPAIQLLKKNIKGLRSENTLLETTPAGDPQANGEAEASVKQAKGQARVLKYALERRLQEPITHDHPLLPWLIEHAGTVITVSRVGPDGKTPFERLKGKKFKGDMVEFGEAVLYRDITEQRAGRDLEPRWYPGIWLGFDLHTHQKIIGTEGKVIKVNTIKRKPEPERWDAEMVKQVHGTPWNPKNRQGGAGGGGGRPRGAATATATAMPRGEPEEGIPHGRPESIEVPEPTEAAPRAVKITRRWVAKYGPTETCPGCMDPAGPGRHTKACRQRMEKAMAETEEGREKLEANKKKKEDYAKRIASEGKEEEDEEHREKSGSTTGKTNIREQDGQKQRKKKEKPERRGEAKIPGR